MHQASGTSPVSNLSQMTLISAKIYYFHDDNLHNLFYGCFLFQLKTILDLLDFTIHNGKPMFNTHLKTINKLDDF